ncbi:methyltransferase-like protein 9 [Sandaracinus amylolyticus]|uniref:methyltransferase-like protein 9 n=1 Tax=Sandaracinus amylolyticus TaxID=927083 RepID=UPI001F348071|nr:methyltransferase-like protein 9 [Sandaracinus amylolyticus]UJR79469.1 Methyltransferase protein 9 [Sandaracinus amylolyticus]
MGDAGRADLVGLSAPALEVLPASLASRYLARPDDADTRAWLDANASRPHGALATMVHRTLRRVASDYDVDAWLGMHPMHLLGTSSWRALLGAERLGGALLDVGAGNGDVTATLAPLFDRVVATETSRPMVRRLRAKGFDAHAIDLATGSLPETSPRFRAIALLDVLDRCARPRSLLDAALAALEPRGALIIASPLPMRPHVDVGGHTVDPDEPLGVEGERFEDALVSLVETLLAPRGLEVERWTRAPYLARGDHDAPLHVLDDVVLVARPR